jgi:predicted phosphohydrolase
MIKFRIISDLHLELYNDANYDSLIKFVENKIKVHSITKDEVLVLPGDLGYAVVMKNGKEIFNPLMERFLKYCKSKWSIVLMVPGNTEYHGILSFETFISSENMMVNKCKELGIIYLNKGVCKIDDCFIVGCTLWSYITSKEWKGLKKQDQEIFMDVDIYRRMYIDHLEWLHEILLELKNQGQKAIVITHYPLETEMKNPSFKIETESGKFLKVDHVQKFLNIHKGVIKGWICGHVHSFESLKNLNYGFPIHINPVGENNEEKVNFGSGIVRI